MTAVPQPKPPVVLFGALRSGTTLMRLILDAHPDICCPGERDFMVDALYSEAGTFKLNAEQLRESRIFLSSGLAVPEGTDGKTAFDSMLAEDAARGEKNHHVLVMHRRLRTMMHLYPDTRFIHLVRDPRDVARSSIGMGWAGSTWFGVDHWVGTESEWDKHGPDGASGQVFSFRYEDMLEAPEETLTRLCAFIGVPYDPAMMDFSKTSTYAPLDPKLAYQWRRKQSEDEIADVEYKVGDLLTRRGYESSGVPARAPGRMRRIVLFLHNKYFTWKDQIHRYGFADPVIEMLSRRIGTPSLGKGARARLREKAKKYLK